MSRRKSYTYQVDFSAVFSRLVFKFKSTQPIYNLEKILLDRLVKDIKGLSKKEYDGWGDYNYRKYFSKEDLASLRVEIKHLREIETPRGELPTIRGPQVARSDEGSD